MSIVSQNLGFRAILTWIEDKFVCFEEKYAKIRV